MTMTENNQDNMDTTNPQAVENSEDQSTDDVRETQTTDDGQETETGKSKAHRDAAKYRTQLRETETALETITTQRDAIARQAIEHHLPSDMPATAFWKLTDGVAAFLNDDGLIDADKVTKTATQLRDDLGINQTGPYVPGQEKKITSINAPNRLENAFKPK